MSSSSRPTLAPAAGLAAALALLLLAAGCLRPPGIRYPGLPTHADGALHVVFFDVGQADAMLLMYRGKSLLIDAGAARDEPRSGVQRIPPRLDALLGTRRLDYFMVSHFHQDHLGQPGRQRNNREPTGIYGLVERAGVSIGTILDRGFWAAGAKQATHRNYERAVEGWLASGAVGARRVLRAGDVIDMGEGLRIEVVAASTNGIFDRLLALYPQIFAGYPPSENDYSIALKITLGEFEMFTAGDLTGKTALRRFGSRTESYNDIESYIAGRVGAVEVYRVDHHGSGHSTNACFAQVLHPQVSVFSTGHNTYGHPDLEVHRRLKRYGDVYITGGADARVRAAVEADIVGDDVELVVAPDGRHLWVNGARYESMTDAAEALRPEHRADCDDLVELRRREANPYGGEEQSDPDQSD